MLCVPLPQPESTQQAGTGSPTHVKDDTISIESYHLVERMQVSWEFAFSHALNSIPSEVRRSIASALYLQSDLQQTFLHGFNVQVNVLALPYVCTSTACAARSLPSKLYV